MFHWRDSVSVLNAVSPLRLWATAFLQKINDENWRLWLGLPQLRGVERSLSWLRERPQNQREANDEQ